MRLRNTELVILAAGASISIYLCGLYSTILPICLLHCCFSLFYYAIQPVGDAIALDALHRKRLSYGHIRVAGVAGSSLCSALCGVLIGSHTERAVPLMALLLACLLPAAWLMPKSGGVPRPGKGRERLRMERPRYRPAFIILLLYGGVAMVSLTFYCNYFSIYFLETAGGSRALLGLSYVFSSVSEIPFFLFGDRMIRRFGAGRVLLWSGCIMMARWLLIALFPLVPVLMATQLLHVCCFAVMTVTIIEYIDHTISAERKVSGQLLFSAFTISSAQFLGSLAGGVVADLFA